MKDVGVVMPVYKQNPVYLELALRSVLQQSYRDFHFVIVSDGAPAETVDVIKRVTAGDARVKLIIKEKNEGVPPTLNLGFDYLMKLPEVKYLTWVSSDNIYYPAFLVKLRAALEKAPANVGLSFSTFTHVDHNRIPLQGDQYKYFNKYQNQPKENLLEVCFIGVSFMYKKSAAAKISGYRLAPVEDYDYWLRITEHCEIVFVPTVLMEYRTNSPDSISAQLKSSKSEHRRWRYAFNLAKLEARNRRNIPFKVTVIYPVQDASEQVMNKLDDLYEQTFSVFKVIIIDRSINQTATKQIQTISDPRVKIIPLPQAGKRQAILEGLKEANTPYTLVYGEGAFPSTQFVLSNMVTNFDLQKRNNIISLFEFGGGNVTGRYTLQQNEPLAGHLYRTIKLREMMHG
ncbi:glycosyltransferase family 2 protein [Radiobacillus sp. PE A8.2]|uniref:glycosyltransferase family 2 protein n=1 Tax=Radiobacillus sp. PE A8.2 TaxID=3380349 RepID=UPI00388FDAB0